MRELLILIVRPVLSNLYVITVLGTLVPGVSKLFINRVPFHRCLIFKVLVEISLFRLSLCIGDLYIIPYVLSFVKNFFQVFSTFFEGLEREVL